MPARPLMPTSPKLAPLMSGGGHGMVGQPLAAHVRQAIERSFLVDLSSVRIHLSPTARQNAAALSARAFAYGNDIFLGPGEHPHDIGLIAHEAAHVVQQQGGSQGGSTVQTWAGARGDRFESEAHAASSAVLRGETFAVRERVTSPRVQRLSISDALNYFADKAYNIPGYRMFTLLIGINPINMQSVERSPANLLRAMIEFIPGGGLITKALDGYGIIDKVGGWIQNQLDTLAITGSSIRQALDKFLDSLSWSDIFHLGGVWDRAKAIFTDPIQRIKNFVVGLVEGIWKFVRDAILKPLAALASKTSGWDLLCAVLGRNPITGEAVPRTAETLIGGFMKLIHQEEVWANIKKANAIPRAWAWFQTALSELMGFVREIPDLFMNTLHSLEWSDVINLPSGFRKIAVPFGTFVGKFISWALEKVWNLLQLVFEVVSPGTWSYIKKTGAALKSILQNPLPFVGNLVRAAKLGFQNFGAHFKTHLQTGLIGWLTGSMPGVYIPKAFSLMELVKFVFSVLGISWANIRAKLVKVVGEPAVKAMEIGFAIVKTLITDGPAAAWEQIKEQLSNLKDMVIGGITDFVTEMVVKKAIRQLVTMFIPGAGFISAILSIYDIIMVFVNQIAKIIQVVRGFIDSIVSIAAGNIGAAAARVESALAGLLSLAINFFAGFVGLGKVADKVRAVIEKVRATIDKALDKLIAWIVNGAKSLFGKLTGKDKKDERTPEQKQADLDKAISEAEALESKKDIKEGEIRAGLPAIAARYKLVSLELVVEKSDRGSETVHIEGEVNPKKKSKPAIVSQGGVITNIKIPRPGHFTSAVEEVYEGTDRKELKLDLCHVISSKDMAEHYENNLKGKTWSDAKAKLDPKIKSPISTPIKEEDILAAAVALHAEFHNDLDNLFLDEMSKNRSLGRVLDRRHPEMQTEDKLNEHIAKMATKYAIGPFQPTRVKLKK